MKKKSDIFKVDIEELRRRLDQTYNDHKKGLIRCPKCESISTEHLKTIWSESRGNPYNPIIGGSHLSKHMMKCKECGHKFEHTELSGC
jgi:DNA-directed RNA polymerase subunit RPC12/RpoP